MDAVQRAAERFWWLERNPGKVYYYATTDRYFVEDEDRLWSPEFRTLRKAVDHGMARYPLPEGFTE